MLKIAYSDIFRYSVPEKHRFPMQKYTMIPERLLAEGTISTDNFFAPACLSEDEILTTHTADYWYQLKTQTLPRKEARAIGFEMTPELVERGRYIAHATYECALYAQQYGAAMNVAGGTHHAFADTGEGFCVFNDIAVAIRTLRRDEPLLHAMVIDLDAHQGNGTHAIFAADPLTFTYSVHVGRNYPSRKEPGDLDVPLPRWASAEQYFESVDRTLRDAVERFEPDIVFYIGGVDVHADDQFGQMKLSTDDMKWRDHLAIDLCRDWTIPTVVLYGGGYNRTRTMTARLHCQTIQVAAERWRSERV